jgi:hypothetical protein
MVVSMNNTLPPSLAAQAEGGGAPASPNHRETYDLPDGVASPTANTQIDEHESILGRPTTCRDANFHDLHCYASSHERPVESPTQGEAIFGFDISDFPYVPDPTQPQVHTQDPWLLYTPAELDTLIGTAPFVMGMGAAMRTQGFENNFGFPADAIASIQGHADLPGHCPSWAPGGASRSTTALDISRTGTASEERNSPRQALLAAADRLLQVASLLD